MSNYSIHKEAPLLEVKNLETAFSIDGELYNAVDKVSFTVKSRQVVGVVGESGCGKSVMSLSV
ncbi:MAG TPA: peptide ABC transporter ATP-binding protein, partial [Bacillus bacterium]|nr:peptide ABC transporter ATP-binding protein [Bacillus sp. (in: firmicutes)]